jgi:hypothetical protein
MANVASSTIVLRSNNRDNGVQRVAESLCQAAATIRPGQLLAVGAPTSTVKPHAVATGNKEGVKVAVDKLFVYPTSGTGLAIDATYAAGETVPYIFASSGDVLYMLIKTGSNVVKGAPLESAGTGALQAATTPIAGTSVDSLVGYAEEAVNNSSGSDARIRVRIA